MDPVMISWKPFLNFEVVNSPPSGKIRLFWCCKFISIENLRIQRTEFGLFSYRQTEKKLMNTDVLIQVVRVCPRSSLESVGHLQVTNNCLTNYSSLRLYKTVQNVNVLQIWKTRHYSACVNVLEPATGAGRPTKLEWIVLTFRSMSIFMLNFKTSRWNLFKQVFKGKHHFKSFYLTGLQINSIFHRLWTVFVFHVKRFQAFHVVFWCFTIIQFSKSYLQILF